MRKLILTAAMAGALMLPATASASFPSYQDRQDAKYFARDYWEAKGLYAPCPNGVRFKVHPVGITGNIGYVHMGGCTIHLNSRAYWNWSKLCTATLHEYGHIVGREHARDPRSVMYPSWPNPIWGKRFWACEYE